MKTLRAQTWLRLVVLMGFLCILGAATASPIFHPAQLQLVCASAGGTALVVMGDDGLAVVTTSIDCPLCLPAAGPATASFDALPTLALAGSAPTSAPRCGDALVLTAAPPPGRGPPFFD